MANIEEYVRKKGKQFRKTVGDLRRFLDGPNWVFITFAGAVFVLVHVFIGGAWSPTTMAVAIFTALYTFVASNQMRQETRTHTANVRRDYKTAPETGTPLFGLRNFGPGPALYLRVYATVVEKIDEEDDEEEVVEKKVILEEDDPPMNLEEGEFLPVLDDAFPTLDPEYDDREMRLYYSFVSRNGTETPEHQSEPRSKSHEELAKDSSNPRSIKLGKLRENCVQDYEVAKKQMR